MVVLVLVICIQVLEDARSVIKDFLWLEEAVEFNHRILGAAFLEFVLPVIERTVSTASTPS